MNRRRPTVRLSLAADVAELLRAMPGDASRFVDEAVRVLAAERAITVESLRAAADRFEPDPMLCSHCEADRLHSAAEHRAAVADGEREWRAAEQRREIGYQLADRLVRAQGDDDRCDRCGAAAHPDDGLRLITWKTPDGIKTEKRCALECDPMGSADRGDSADRWARAW